MTTATTPNPPSLTGIGRDVLEKRVRDGEIALADARLALTKAERERDDAKRDCRYMLGTLTSAQELATKYLGIARAVKAIGDDPIMQELALLGAAIVRARKLHPEGCAIVDLVSEVGELATAMLRETPERVDAEALDVATVATRLFLGEGRK